MSESKFVIPNGLPPNSTDPLKIDQFNNYFPGQMLFTQPLVTSVQGELSSEVLDRFSYDSRTHKITLSVKQGISFSTGDPINAEDVAFSIARLAYSRPKFPVLRFIAGLESWRSGSEPLMSFPEGIKVEHDDVTIQLDRGQLNPLFRFTLNVVSIIPRRCVDPKTNSITCQSIPSSGYYVSSQASSNSVSFKKRPDISKSLPSVLSFEYPKLTGNILSYLRHIDDNTVVFLYDLDVTADEYSVIENEFQIVRLAESWFSGFLLNPSVEPFNDIQFRRWFLQELHEILSLGHSGPTVYSRSIFPEIVPGFLPSEKFEKFKFSLTQVTEFKKKLKGMNFEWAIRKSTPPPTLFRALRKMSQKFSFILAEPIIAESSHSGWKSYQKVNVALQTSHSGFWPLDPIGDIQMLFTPDLHQDYIDIWSDRDFNILMSELAAAEDLKSAKLRMTDINVYLYRKALLSIFSHQSYFYVRKKGPNTFVPQGTVSLTVPYPWQVFDNEQQ